MISARFYVLLILSLSTTQVLGADGILTVKAKPGSPIAVTAMMGTSPCTKLPDGQKICGKATNIIADIVPADGSLEVVVSSDLRKSAEMLCAQNDRTGELVCKDSTATLIKF